MSGSWFGARNPTRMSIVATVESLWRYPVKSMRGEELDEMFAGYSGVYGDRLFAFKSSASPKRFPYLTGREQRQMLRYRPRFRDPDKAARPINLTEAESLSANPVSADLADLMVDVETPTGETVAIDDPKWIDMLREGVEETGTPVDKRRFRANVYVNLASAEGFAENAFVGRSLRIGPKLVVTILERDPRCMMITLDPDTGEKTPAILQQVAQSHDGMAGVYGAVMVEGMLHKGDSVELLD